MKPPMGGISSGSIVLTPCQVQAGTRTEKRRGWNGEEQAGTEDTHQAATAATATTGELGLTWGMGTTLGCDTRGDRPFSFTTILPR